MKYGKIYPQGEFNYDGWHKVYDSDEESISFPTSSDITVTTDGDTDEVYLIDAFFVADTTGTRGVTLEMNGDTGSNYGYQYLRGQNTTISAARNTSDTKFPIMTAPGPFNCLLYAKSGNERVLSFTRNEPTTGTTVNNVFAYGASWNNTGSNLTSLVFSITAGTFNSGTRIIVWKKVT